MLRPKSRIKISYRLGLFPWHRIRQDILKDARAEYGKQTVANLANELTLLYGTGFGSKNLFKMVRFAEVFPRLEIVATLWLQLSWSHFREIIYLKDDLKRAFYAEMCRVERWSVRTLQHKIRLMLYERTAVAKKPEDVISQELNTLRDTDQMTPDLVFRDPYVLDFLGLPPLHSESDLESAIIAELERFLLELGAGFCFVARQKRMSIGMADYYLDLLFYHRDLRRLVAIELKIGRFSAADKGQMELYLRWLEKYECREGEEPPIGLVLCAERDEEQIELLRLDEGEIRVAEYLTAMPPRTLLEEKLRQAILHARERSAEILQNEPEQQDN
jgi:predicted nuclease of restriction endonuclease-like (RecB) superfamily